MTDTTPLAQIQALAHSVMSPNVVKAHINGFGLLVGSSSELTIVGNDNSLPVLTMSMNMHVAKSLSRRLSEVVEQYEKSVGELLTMEEIEIKMKANPPIGMPIAQP